MRKYVFSLLFVIVGLVSVFTQEKEIDIVPSESKNFIFQLGMGSAYTFYFYDIQTALDTMDKNSIGRIPFSLDFLFGKKMSDSTAWTVSLNSGIDIFYDSSDSFQLYTFLLSAGFQYIPFQNGLTLGMNVGGTILVPNTTLSYIGNTEFGSNISIDIEYFFETLKFSNLGIAPGLGIKYIHSEMKRGFVNQICGYMNLRIR